MDDDGVATVSIGILPAQTSVLLTFAVEATPEGLAVFGPGSDDAMEPTDYRRRYVVRPVGTGRGEGGGLIRVSGDPPAILGDQRETTLHLQVILAVTLIDERHSNSLDRPLFTATLQPRVPSHRGMPIAGCFRGLLSPAAL